jgi:hypothetical protein
MADAVARAQRNDVLAVKDQEAKTAIEYLTTVNPRFPRSEFLREAVHRYIKKEYPDLWRGVPRKVRSPWKK